MAATNGLRASDAMARLDEHLRRRAQVVADQRAADEQRRAFRDSERRRLNDTLRAQLRALRGTQVKAW